MKNFAIVQNKISFGGRLDVIIAITKFFNQKGMKPDILSFEANDINKKNIKKHYNIEIDFNLKKIKRTMKLPHELDILAFNLKLRHFKNKYDFFINSNNTSFLMPNLPMISYVHFPRKYRLRSKYKSIHDKKNKRKKWLRSKRDFLHKLLQKFYFFNFNIQPKNLIVCNSEFTKSKFKEIYPNYNKKVEVIYPPVSIDNKVKYSKKNSVITLGRFSKNKGQMEQLKIAKESPDIKFYIVGFAKKKNNYNNKCLDYKKNNNLNNVRLVRNASFREKMDLLKNSKIFLNTTKNEPFGITTVEAIMAGCLPIVYDSGGQKEIVSLPDLRFEYKEKAIKLINSIDEITYREKINYLQKHIKKFDIGNFLKEFDKIYSEFKGKYL